MERITARNWYWWLWLSPVFTIPTLFVLFEQDIDYMVRSVTGSGYDTLPIVFIILLSALWHLVLLIPSLNKDSAFIRWHGRQALLLAGIRTAIPIFLVLLTGEQYGLLLAIPILLIVWFFGTLWGQIQASRGECTLMRWFRSGEGLITVEPEADPIAEIDAEPDALVEIIRFSQAPRQRRAALNKLQDLRMVERMDGKEIKAPLSQSAATVHDPMVVQGGGSGWFVALVIGLVLATLWVVSSGSNAYRDHSYAATFQPDLRTATVNAEIVEIKETLAAALAIDTSATAQVVQAERDKAAVWPLILQSDFDASEDAWETGVEEDGSLSGSRKILNGIYQWEAQVAQDVVWFNIPEIERPLFDYILSVDVARVIGPADSGYGVVLRHIDDDNFMIFMVEDERSQARVNAKVNGEWNSIYSFSIPAGGLNAGGVNRVEAIVEDTTITLIVNDGFVGSFEDFHYGYGDIGLAVNLSAGDFGRFSFDNFELRAAIPEAAVLVASGENLARKGALDQAIIAFEEAHARDPDQVAASSWNTLCWFGSLWGYALEVREACDIAVELDPDHGGLRDSRGLARALTGDHPGAIMDFAFFVEWCSQTEGCGTNLIRKRESWIVDLENGQNPFDAVTLELLKSE